MTWIDSAGIREGDVVVKTFDRGGDNPIYWIAIIYRDEDDEFLKIQCWDGEWTSYQPDIPSGNLPDGVTIVDDKK